MLTTDPRHHEIVLLLEHLFESGLDAQQSRRLEELVGNDPAARRLMRDSLLLHGDLHWDTAEIAEPLPVSASTDPFAEDPGDLVADELMIAETIRDTFREELENRRRQRVRLVRGAMVIAPLLLIAAVLAGSGLFGPTDPSNVAEVNPEESSVIRPTEPDRSRERVVPEPQPVVIGPDEPLRLRPRDRAPSVTDPVPPTEIVGQPDPAPLAPENVVAFIDEELVESWEEAEIEPSPHATDSEWVRRIYLDLTGRIPTAEEAERFLASTDPDRHARLVDELLDRPDYDRHMATVWTNLLVGRADRGATDRDALRNYLASSFDANQGWDDTVAELVAAEGSPDENGAAGFLLAHLNNEAVPATAFTARVFLGQQVQCLQCHDHPDPRNNAQQELFWELNSFFKGTEIVEERTPKKTVRRLVSKLDPNPVFFETRQGVVRTVGPKYAGEEVPETDPNLRARLAELITTRDESSLATAMVNRTWQHFFGRAFTAPVDDMGPHNPPTHPELLDTLSREFVRSGYDIKQLIRWIATSDAYRRSSRITPANEIDNPEIGELPLFSRVYVKPMTAEQVYDSLHIASRGSLGSEARRQREHWLQEFVHDYETEENNEQTEFDGTIGQALVMMNGDLVEDVVAIEPGSLLDRALSTRGGLKDQVRELALATVSREPTPAELEVVKQTVRKRVRNHRQPPREATAATLQDLLWAYVNSSEFILVH